MAVLSIVILIAVIAIACWKKLNAGVLSIVGALILLVISGNGTKGALANFNGTLFIQYAMIMLVYGTASYTGGLQLLLKKVLRFTGNKVVRYLPLILFALGLVTSLAGAGGTIFNAFIILTAVLGPNLGIHPLLMPVMMLLGTNAGTLHPKHQAGLVALSILEPLGYGVEEAWTLYYVATILATLFALVLYVVLKGYRVNAESSIDMAGADAKFTYAQKVTLIGMLIQIILTNVTTWDVGMIAAAIVVVEILLGALTQKEALTKIVSYPTLIMICGVSILVKQVQAFGGIDLIVNTIAPMITKVTVTPFVALMSGSLSWVSSTMGVVMPTVMPLLDGFSASAGGSVGFSTLLVACVSTSHMAAISPMSTGGGSVMAYVTSQDPNADTALYFKKMWIISICAVLFNVLLSLVGIVGIFSGLF